MWLPGHVGGDVRYLLFYFSFTTLTTVSFGDILPASEFVLKQSSPHEPKGEQP
ncbi:MAG: hypothetical protein HZC17_09975 [Candidatus Omnitrophica bacterium]|nr:hypothetical protein [Candidatus Omnitrophota bacterium]